MATRTILAAMKETAEEYAWESTLPSGLSAAPQKVVIGGIGAETVWPVLGILATRGEPQNETLGGTRYVEVYEWTFACPMELLDPSAVYLSLLGLRDEARDLITSDPAFGTAVIDNGFLLGWEASVYSFDDGHPLVGVWIQSITQSLEVQYNVAD